MANVNMKERQSTYANTAPGYANHGAFLNHNVSQAQALRAQPYLPPNPALMAHTSADTSLTALAHSFGGMNLHQPMASFGSSANTGRSHLSGASAEYGGVPMAQASAYYLPNQQHLLYSGSHLQGANQAHAGMPHASNLYAPTAHFVPQANYGSYGQHLDSPNTQSWATSRVPSGEMPTLITPRRDSISSAENDLPGTPSYTAYRGYNNGFAVVDRSPSAGYTHSGTPSPSQLGPQYGIPQIAKAQPTPVVSPELQQLLAREPAIPRAIPAPSSPLKPLDRSLENKNGETNVYIRGLMPETTDDMLHQWGVRFGDIQSSKAIIDLKTNLCKGFGFIKYHNFEDAENCIRGFHYLGYEESFYAKLKKFSDEGNTNLYVSNIPRNMNEHARSLVTFALDVRLTHDQELSEIFLPYEVCSAKVLRDSSGHGRGVGFARFQTRDVCEEIIKKFNNYPVTRNGEEHLIQIRYSDTHEQKMLKQQTAAARQFRAAEFEYGVLQARNGGLLPPAQPQRISNLTASEHEAANEFENFLNNNATAGVHKAPRYGQGSLRFAPTSVPAFSIQRNSSLPVPQVNVPARKRTNDDPSADAKARPATPTIANGDNSSDTNNVGSDQE